MHWVGSRDVIILFAIWDPFPILGICIRCRDHVAGCAVRPGWSCYFPLCCAAPVRECVRTHRPWTSNGVVFVPGGRHIPVGAQRVTEDDGGWMWRMASVVVVCRVSGSIQLRFPARLLLYEVCTVQFIRFCPESVVIKSWAVKKWPLIIFTYYITFLEWNNLMLSVSSFCKKCLEMNSFF